jgi:hypothetical protein
MSHSVPDDVLRHSEQIPGIIRLITDLSESKQIQGLILDGVRDLQNHFKGKHV